MYNQFQELIIDDSLRELASDHAEKRTKEIVRQFIPQNAPLSAVESNYIGALGEIAVRIFLGLNPLLEDNYHHHNVDDGDIEWNGKVYDVKTDAVVSSSYKKIFDGLIKPYEPYACRVWTTKHAHYLPKYTGGLIFCVIEIPNNAKETKYEGVIRDVIFNNDVYVTGPCIVASRNRWSDLEMLVNHNVNELLKNDLIDDDQTLLLMSYLSAPELFELHRVSGQDWFVAFKDYHESLPA